ncbi:hypothetical protein J2X36_000797 [Methylobacterium sp. BE186]|uniref:hypothetical protein n=1 Tax=Methylobacterium sp. BE186 TaxID=2817715 RepID=UPI002859F4A0|nr:hypothetical protein [Methylobacterium sp. BE186]MDR7036061.1 hypothetical protein [Methylobacterium sp. BE186]
MTRITVAIAVLLISAAQATMGEGAYFCAEGAKASLVSHDSAGTSQKKARRFSIEISDEMMLAKDRYVGISIIAIYNTARQNFILLAAR